MYKKLLKISIINAYVFIVNLLIQDSYYKIYYKIKCKNIYIIWNIKIFENIKIISNKYEL